MSEPKVYAQDFAQKEIEDRFESIQEILSNCTSHLSKVVKAKQEIINLYFTKQKCQRDIDELNKISLLSEIQLKFDSDLTGKIDEQNDELIEIENEMSSQQSIFSIWLKEYRKELIELQKISKSFEDFLKKFIIETGGLE